ncbi:hypothetical protein DFJ74DRAFT_49304 [Hyaloraphidium curvatum]|nr:hypothetical protein DFJ74DRAFT_49304 [Hyaloraphidium curvatum]
MASLEQPESPPATDIDAESGTKDADSDGSAKDSDSASSPPVPHRHASRHPVSAFFASRWSSFRSVNPLAEISGAFGDIGTLLPIIVALTKKGGIDLTSTLLFGGAYGILAGLWFNVPVPVQPMKSIASVAMANSYTMAEIVAAGFYVSCVIGFLGLTNLVLPISRVVTLPLVRGLQLGTGLVLAINGVSTLQSSNGWSFAGWAWLDNYLWSILAFLAVFATYNSRFTFSALLIFVLGIILAALKIYLATPGSPGLRLGFSPPPVLVPAFGSTNAILGAALGQIPLTLLNSVVAVSKLAGDLFPERNPPRGRGAVPLRDVALSVGFMNIVSCWFGCSPYCHGAGGLAAQYRFGARTGLSLVILGLVKVSAALAFGASLAGLLGAFPNSLLGVMLVVAGVELGSAARDVSGHEEFVVTLVTASALAGFRNDGIALLCGMAVSVLFYLAGAVGRLGWRGTAADVERWCKWVWTGGRGLGQGLGCLN